jgi:hypothetical protein
VQRLEGGRKRRAAREVEENGTSRAGTANANERGEEEDNGAEEESRAGAIRKRVRVDPFEPGGKKTKRKKEKEKKKQAEGETALAEDDVAMEEPTATGDAMTTRPGAKKKRKKAPLEGSLAGPAVGGEAARSEDRDADVGQHPGPSMQSLLDEWGGLWNHQQRSRGGTPGSSFSGNVSLLAPLRRMCAVSVLS